MLILFALLKLAFHIATNGRYGFHRDELATLDDALHLAWGYVAYPPLTPFIGRIELFLFGPSLRGFRFFAAGAQSLVVVVTGLMARRFGGGRGAQLLAGAAIAIAPISLAASSLFQYVTFDLLWFVLMAYFVIRLVDSSDGRWWLAIGASIGFGVMTKYTMAFFVAGLVVGVLATPLRAHLRSRWLWIGAALSIVIAAPNLIWQMQHDFISLEFLKSIHARDVRIGRTSSFLPDQFVISSNILAAPLWIAGLVALFRNPKWRILGWMTVVPFALFIVAHGRGYYTGPLFAALLAAGAVEFERLTAGRRWPWAIASALCVTGGVVAAICVLPLAPVHSRLWSLSQSGDLVEELGWPELTREVARIYATIPPAERARTAIYCANYGEAGAVDLYGKEYGLPDAISGINSYWLRGPGNPPPQTLIVLGSSREGLERRFSSVTLAGHTPNPWKVKNEETTEHPDIFVCRGPFVPIDQLWPKIRSFG